jgi:hypothetical protein
MRVGVRVPARRDSRIDSGIESKHPMSKRQLIDDIRRHNVSVQPQFLAQFDEAALKQYLRHLEGAQQKRMRIGGWVKRQPKLRLVS